MIVYKASQKALKKNIYELNDRLVFVNETHAVHFIGNKMIQADVFHRKPDSHVVATDEKCPDELLVTQKEYTRILKYKISVPMKIKVDPNLIMTSTGLAYITKI